jgi:hypothetical protein
MVFEFAPLYGQAKLRGSAGMIFTTSAFGFDNFFKLPNLAKGLPGSLFPPWPENKQSHYGNALRSARKLFFVRAGKMEVIFTSSD